jgi:glucan-binding YG repeat protein
VVIANPSVRDASVSVAVNIKVTNPQIKLSFDNTGFLAGTAKNITVSKDPADYSAGLTWSSSDTSVATVNNGTVTGIKEGTATITCTDDIGLSSSVSVSVGETVIPTGIKIIAGTTVFIYSSNDHISSQFQYEITPSTFTGTVIWSSGDSGVATVDNNGLVTPVASGVTDITCTIAGYPNINDKIQVNVIATTVPADYEMGKQVINSAPSSTTSAGNILSNSEAVYTQTENTGAVSIVNSSSAAATLYSGSISEFLKNNGTDNSTMGDLIADDKNNEAVKVIPKNYGTGYDNSSAANSSANNTANDLTIHASTSLNDLKSVTMTAEATAQQINIDGQFDKMTGSTIINFHKDFLDTLQPGNYVVRLNYWDKYIDTEITINGAPLHFADGSVNSSYRAEAMETGGHFTGSGDFWSFVKSDGAWTSNEWICYNGRPYYIGKGGLMRSGLIMDTSGAVYLLSSLHDGHYGAAVSGWVKDADGNIYFFDPETYKMVTGEKMIDHTTCTFADDGHMIS